MLSTTSPLALSTASVFAKTTPAKSTDRHLGELTNVALFEPEMVGWLLVCVCMARHPKGVVLTIVDGFGESAWRDGNGIESANMPTFDYLKAHYPYISLVAAQQPVGLIRGEPGSSAVGHQTIGLGRTTPSYFQQLEKGLNPNAKESLLNNKVLRSALKKAKHAHFFGLCTDEGVFSHPRFLPPLFEAAKAENVSEVNVHCVLTTLTRKPSEYLKETEALFPEGMNIKLAAVYSGETAMDRLGKWDLTRIAYRAMLDSSGVKHMKRKELFKYLDQFDSMAPSFDPVYLKPVEGSSMQDGDTVVIFNYREDKTWQIVEALLHGLKGEPKHPKLNVVPLIMYHPSQKDVPQMIPPVRYENGLGEWISKQGFKQLRVAEQYKRAHITTFFSGGILQPVFPGEDRITNFESAGEAEVHLVPKMNASRIADAVISGMKSGEYKLIACNFANVDATGHTGNVTAVRLAAEHVDKILKRILQACRENDYALVVTADHGNGEDDTDLDGSPQVFHTLNNVPFVAVTDDYEIAPLRTGRAPYIGNVASSVLTIMGLEIPREMEPSLLRPARRPPNCTLFIDISSLLFGFSLAIPTFLLISKCIGLGALIRGYQADRSAQEFLL